MTASRRGTPVPEFPPGAQGHSCRHVPAISGGRSRGDVPGPVSLRRRLPIASVSRALTAPHVLRADDRPHDRPTSDRLRGARNCPRALGALPPGCALEAATAHVRSGGGSTLRAVGISPALYTRWAPPAATGLVRRVTDRGAACPMTPDEGPLHRPLVAAPGDGGDRRPWGLRCAVDKSVLNSSRQLMNSSAFGNLA